MKLRYWDKHRVFFAEASFGEKDVLKEAGFIWDKIVRKHWATHDVDVAGRLSRFADPACQEAIANGKRARFEAISKSSATDSHYAFPKPDGLDYLPFQKAGIEWAVNHPACIIGDDMGLGKTIQAIGLINTDPLKYRHVLVVCKASLKINWKRELQKWLIIQRHIAIVEDNCLPYADIVIVNFDRLAKLAHQLRSEEWDLVVIDESQHLGNRKAQRTVAIFGGKLKGEEVKPLESKYRMALTGTPIRNRLAEFYPLLHWLAPEEYRSFYHYAKEYCGIVQTQFGTDYSGRELAEADRLARAEKLQRKLRATLMIRRLKADVLKELPPIRYQVIELPCPPEHREVISQQLSQYDATEAWIKEMKERVEAAQVAGNKEEYNQALSELKAGEKVRFEEMAKMRHTVAQIKFPIAIQYLKDAYDETGEKHIVFGHHRDILEGAVAEFPNSVLLYGGMSENEKQVSVDTFQNDPNCTHFFGSIRAAGEGLTLTASAYVTFMEFDWTPGQIDQGISRAHRIGQTRGVLATYLVLEGSLDARMIEVFAEKARTIGAAVDYTELKESEEAGAL